MARVATAFKSRGLSLDAKFFIFALVLFWVGLIVLYPILLLIVDSFKIGDGVFRPREGWGIANWVSAYTNPGLLRALGNTVFVVIIVQAISVPIGVGVAWLLARSDLPGKEWIDLAMWVAFFLPTLPIVLGYVLLLAPEFGLANKAWTTVFGGVSGPFNIYSVAGIIWMHLVTKTIVVKAILLRPIFANMDASLEESARICGTNTPFTIVRIVVPLMMPAVATVTMLGVLFGLESFEIERVLGPPIQFHNYGTFIFREVAKQPPEFANATALGVSVLLLMAPIILLQQWNSRRRRFTTITGQFKPQLFTLGRAKWPAFAIVFFLVSLMTLVPVGFMLVGSFMKLFGFFAVSGSPFTLSHWSTVFSDSIFLSSVRNTLVMAFGAAFVAMTVYSVVAYLIVKTKFVGRQDPRFRILDADHNPGRRAGAWLLARIPRCAVPSARVRHSLGIDCGCLRYLNDHRRTAAQEQPPSDRRGTGGGVLAGRGQLAPHVPVHRPATDRTDVDRGGDTGVRRRDQSGRTDRYPDDSEQSAARDAPARSHD